MKPVEQSSRDKLRQRKPLVLDKILKHEKEQIPRIQLQYRYNCNFKCQHCSIDSVKDLSRKSLSIDDVKNLFKQADEMGISRVTISGGEPLLFPDLDELVEAINPKLFWIQLDTNAFLLTEDKVKHLKEIGIDCIAPSLDSLNLKEHDDFRNQPGSASKVLTAVEFIKDNDINIFIQTVVTKTRLYSREFIDFLQYFTVRGIGVFVSFAKPVGAFSGHFEECIEKEDLKYFEQLEKEYIVFSHLTPAYGLNEERKCVASKNIFGITQHGDVLSCIYFYCSMGNVLEEPLKDIYERCIKLKPFNKHTCVLADKSDEFIEKYLVKKIYGKKLPVHYTEVFDEGDFE
jgi:MoaA/NifB/PqqE/SkfB family radical SAM enzyme